MFSTSGDILNLVLAVCVAALTIFLCTSLYYFISSFKKVHQLLRIIESGVNKTEELINLAKDKIRNGGAYLMILGELAKKAMDYFSDKGIKKKTDKKTSKKK